MDELLARYQVYEFLVCVRYHVSILCSFFFHDLEFHETSQALNLWLDMPQYEKLYDVFADKFLKEFNSTFWTCELIGIITLIMIVSYL